MHAARFSLVCLVLAALTASAAPAAAQAMSVDEFRRELVGVPLCGTPETGPLAGKALCTVHLPDGTAILAGAGLVVHGLWEADAGKICRRNRPASANKRRCATSQRVDRGQYRNSDGVGFCLGPCESDK